MGYSEFDKRMKEYEYVTRNYLIKKTPVIIRIDGKAFHTFTKGLKKPFDDILSNTMQQTMECLCKSIQGCVLGYTQSDEISLILIDYQDIDTDAWFDYNIQKCASVSAGIASAAFNHYWRQNVLDAIYDCSYDPDNKNYADNVVPEKQEEYNNLTSIYMKKDLACFDARVFNLPKEEVCNNIYWRQQDATRNSIQMLGRAYFSHKQLLNKSCSEIQDMLMSEYGINWNDTSTKYKRGSCCIRKYDSQTGRNSWVIDNEIPIFKGDGRKYIDDLVYLHDTAVEKSG